MRHDDMPLPILIEATYESTCRECNETIKRGTWCYWRRGERAICVECYNALHVDDVVNVVTPVTTTSPTYTSTSTSRTTPPPVGSPNREERISQMHLEKMLMLGEIVAAVKALTAAEEKRNEYLKKEADR